MPICRRASSTRNWCGRNGLLFVGSWHAGAGAAEGVPVAASCAWGLGWGRDEAIAAPTQRRLWDTLGRASLGRGGGG